MHTAHFLDLGQMTYPIIDTAPEKITQFFERVKQRLNNEEAYSEFLKCINIYSSEIITKSELLDLVDDIIGEHQDLMKTLKKLLTPSNSIGSFY